MRATPKDKREVNLNKNIKLPRNMYSLRIKQEEFKISSKDNPMIVLTYEFIAPETFVNPVDNSIVNIAGVEVHQKRYITLSVKDDAEKSQKMFDQYSDLRDQLGKPIGPDEDVDINNPPKVFEGLVIDAICDGVEYVQRKDPTPAQKAKGEPGDPILVDGKQVKAYLTEVKEILGLSNAATANAAANRPY